MWNQYKYLFPVTKRPETLQAHVYSDLGCQSYFNRDTGVTPRNDAIIPIKSSCDLSPATFQLRVIIPNHLQTQGEWNVTMSPYFH